MRNSESRSVRRSMDYLVSQCAQQYNARKRTLVLVGIRQTIQFKNLFQFSFGSPIRLLRKELTLVSPSVFIEPLSEVIQVCLKDEIPKYHRGGVIVPTTDRDR